MRECIFCKELGKITLTELRDSLGWPTCENCAKEFCEVCDNYFCNCRDEEEMDDEELSWRECDCGRH